jgi:hypothetical protein
MLKDVRINIAGKTVKTFGGLGPVPADLLVRCLHRMGAWAQLSKVITDSAFPAFELCACFAVFNLSARAHVNRHVCENWRTRALDKLARAFKQPVEDVRAQFFDLYPIAQNIYRADAVANTDAWSLAVRRRLARQGY